MTMNFETILSLMQKISALLRLRNSPPSFSGAADRRRNHSRGCRVFSPPHGPEPSSRSPRVVALYFLAYSTFAALCVPLVATMADRSSEFTFCSHSLALFDSPALRLAHTARERLEGSPSLSSCRPMRGPISLSASWLAGLIWLNH